MPVIVKDSTTDNVVEVPDHYVGHPILGANLVPVTEEKTAASSKKVSSATTTDTTTESN
jgi:hypothetical protein